MAIEKRPVTPDELMQIVEWLDEQRRLDHEHLLQLAREVDGMRAAFSGQVASRARPDAGPPGRSLAEQRVADEAMMRLVEQVVLLERALTEHVEVQTRSTQSEAAQRERERRALAELAQGADALGRSIEGLNDRLLAVAEQVRHGRDALPPIVQAIEEIQRAQASLQSRVGALDQMTRRLAATQSLVEQSADKQANDLARVENQVKLLDLRLTRDAAELNRLVEAWRVRAEEQLKPIDGLARQIAALVEQREVVLGQIAANAEAIQQLTVRLEELAGALATDRATFSRLTEAIEAQVRRSEASGASLWQLGERMNALAGSIDQVRSDLQGLSQQAETLTRRLERAEDERQHLETALAALEGDLRAARREATERVDGLGAQVDAELNALRAQADARFRLTVDQLRRRSEELQQQVRELEGQLS